MGRLSLIRGNVSPVPSQPIVKEYLVSAKMKVLLTKDVEKLGHAGAVSYTHLTLPTNREV